MTLLVLSETSAGYAVFKAKDKKLLARDDLVEEASTAEGICSLLKLKKFHKFDSAAVALNEAAAVGEAKVSPLLASILDEYKDEKKGSLAVTDPKLGNAITKLPGLTLQPISDSTTNDLYRAIREHLPSLLPDLLKDDDLKTTSLGLSHSLSRHKLKFSPDKVDTMIIQAIGLLDDLDKELNMNAMRAKEWYGWHFPEMAKIINDNVAYSKIILHVGMRSNCASTDLSDILPEEIETAVKAAAEVSMGTEMTEEDLEIIQRLAGEVVGLTEHRQELSMYLNSRMQAIAPNLTALVGELVGARLIAKSGSLMSLSKSPASTIQVLGAEKALFRALKTKHDTPKYGLIYHASLIGQATGKNKGKIARMLAAKAALGIRVDSLSEWGANAEVGAPEPTEEEKSAMGVSSRNYIERRLRALENRPIRTGAAAIGNANLEPVTQSKWEIKEARKYNKDADGLAGNEEAKITTSKKPSSSSAAESSSAAKSKAKAKIEEIPETVAGASPDEDVDSDVEMGGTAKKDSDVDEDGLSKSERKALKRAKKEEKKAKKAAKAAKKAAKAAEEQVEELPKESKKKRKLDGEADGEKKKKKKKRSEE
ncbi:Nop domain-containing protein [Aulographum hederae CBS 113979]|uniref:Nucleolar protein 58 n=1 Tax=Aulographum hederae CBS 113979 TaxID=1176131 RepID=A0A6G1GR67_9PEZI|nr:Nop domain-containing protein [Aulographum hederae CBS 113979]